MPKKSRLKNKNLLPRILVVAGVLILAILILVFKQDRDFNDAATPTPVSIAELQLDRALQAGEPTLAFFHSDNCKQCIVMMETVNHVYPEFSTLVTLVDVNVYDMKNAGLLKSVGLQYIPTLIFYDQSGEKQVSVGVMETEQLRQTLAALAGKE